MSQTAAETEAASSVVLDAGARCQGKKPDGSACKVPAAPGRQYCPWHDPERVAEVNQWRSRGGEKGKLDYRMRASGCLEATDLDLSTAEAREAILAQVIDAVTNGRMPKSSAEAVIAAVVAARAEAEDGELVNKLDEVKELLTEVSKGTLDAVGHSEPFAVRQYRQ